MSESPFPGMDPYLERFWRDVHHRLVTYAADALQPNLPEDLRARVEERVFVETEEPISQGFIEIVDAATGNRVVTVIEFISLSNKLPGAGRQLYLRKQREVLESGTYNLGCSGDDTLYLICNGQTLVYDRHSGPATDTFRQRVVQLEKGTHYLIAYTGQLDNYWHLIVRFNDRDGQPADHIIGLPMTDR